MPTSKPTPMPWPLRRARRDRIVKAMRAGGTAESVAQKEGVTIQLVRYYSKEAGLKLGNQKRLGAKEVSASTFEILAGLLHGGEVNDLAEKFNVPRQSVDKIRRKALAAGIELP